MSYSKSQIKTVTEYIENQELHHQKKTFREEYLEMLQKFEENPKIATLYKEKINGFNDKKALSLFLSEEPLVIYSKDLLF